MDISPFIVKIEDEVVHSESVTKKTNSASKETRKRKSPEQERFGNGSSPQTPMQFSKYISRVRSCFRDSVINNDDSNPVFVAAISRVNLLFRPVVVAFKHGTVIMLHRHVALRDRITELVPRTSPCRYEHGINEDGSDTDFHFQAFFALHSLYHYRFRQMHNAIQNISKAGGQRQVAQIEMSGASISRMFVRNPQDSKSPRWQFLEVSWDNPIHIIDRISIVTLIQLDETTNKATPMEHIRMAHKSLEDDLNDKTVVAFRSFDSDYKYTCTHCRKTLPDNTVNEARNAFEDATVTNTTNHQSFVFCQRCRKARYCSNLCYQNNTRAHSSHCLFFS
jgi:hypothetical protein